MRLIIVHGAGSFGTHISSSDYSTSLLCRISYLMQAFFEAHPHAKASKVHLGIPNKESAEAVVFGLCDTRFGLHKMSQRILDTFIAEKTPVSLTSVFPGWKTNTVYSTSSFGTSCVRVQKSVSNIPFTDEGVKTSQIVEEHTCKTLLELVNLGVIPMLHVRQVTLVSYIHFLILCF